MKSSGSKILKTSRGSVFVMPWGPSQDNSKIELRGSWTAALAVCDGEPAPTIVGRVLTLHDGRFKIQSKTREVLYQGKFEVNESTLPSKIDLLHEFGNTQGTMWKGIFTLVGGNLLICDNGPNPERERPTDFATRYGSDRMNIMFQRRE